MSKGVKTHKFFKNYWCWPKGSHLTWIVRKPRHHKFLVVWITAEIQSDATFWTTSFGRGFDDDYIFGIVGGFWVSTDLKPIFFMLYENKMYFEVLYTYILMYQGWYKVFWQFWNFGKVQRVINSVWNWPNNGYPLEAHKVIQDKLVVSLEVV